MPSFRRHPASAFKLLAAFLVVSFYLVLRGFPSTESRTRKTPLFGTRVQFEGWKNDSGAADEAKADQVVNAMKYTFWRYKEYAWGYDDIKPVSGGNKTSRNGWGAFIVDTTTTLALMGLWDELALEVDHIVDSIDFNIAQGLVDPFETTIRYLGALVSLTDLLDAGVVPSSAINSTKRDAILSQAITLANKLAPSFDSPTGIIWPRVNFTTNLGVPDPPSVYESDPSKPHYKNPSIGPARAGSNILENRVLSRLTNDPTYLRNATRAWAPLVWNSYITPWPGMVDAPVDIFTGEPVGRQRHWDAGHDSYYEYLLKIALLAPKDRYADTYRDRWLTAASTLRYQLASRSAPSQRHDTQHLFMGKQNDNWFENEQSHLSCFAAGNLMLGGRYFKYPNYISLGKALLEACHHTYVSTPTQIGPESWSWVPKFGVENATFEPSTPRQEDELKKNGFWVADARYRLRPEYVESLFYAYRITGEQRYRDWAWDAFLAFEKYCKTPYGYAGIRDVMRKPRTINLEEEALAQNEGEGWWIDESESFWGAETLKYLWLIFSDKEVGSLDRWVYSTEGHPFRMIR